MRRVLVSILLILYMAGAMGATVHMHYCMGDIAGVSLLSYEGEHKCSKCGMIKKTASNGCCEDVEKTLKTAEHYKSAPSYGITGLGSFILPAALTVFAQNDVYVTVISDVSLPVHPPPDEINSLPLYLQLRNLRI